ncbi:MAG: glycosyltransferase family 2 protein [Planctomycetota bacterium]|nr:glycosyltransferase family 2 protein [Planctomycetota bacterium]
MSKTVSIVVPCFNEAEVLPLLYDRLIHLPQIEGIDFEIILVDDGSTDSTWPQLKAFAQTRPYWKAVRLARNFGHQKALWTGLSRATGEAVFVIDADLQDPPELIEEFIHLWECGSDVVYGVRRKRKEGFLKRFAYASFYRILAKVADVRIPLDAGDFCLMDRKVIQAMQLAREPNPFIRGARAWVGFQQTAYEYERDSRAAGVEKYRLKQLFELATNGLFSYSSKPLKGIAWAGVLMGGVSVLLAVAALVLSWWGAGFWSDNLGTVGLVSVMGLFTAIQLIAIGLVGVYVGRTLEMASQRPTAIVSDLVEGPQESFIVKLSREDVPKKETPAMNPEFPVRKAG